MKTEIRHSRGEMHILLVEQICCTNKNCISPRLCRISVASIRNAHLHPLPMAWKRYLWSTYLALVTFLRLADLISFDLMSYSPYMPNLGSLSHSYCLEVAAVIH